MTADSKVSARLFLGLVALFLGELRDGLTMINMQSAFLIVSKLYSEKQAGILFFVFGMSQILFQAPAGYIMDYTDRKVAMLAFASVATTAGRCSSVRDKYILLVAYIRYTANFLRFHSVSMLVDLPQEYNLLHSDTWFLCAVSIVAKLSSVSSNALYV